MLGAGCPYSTSLRLGVHPDLGPAPLGLGGGIMDVGRLKVEVRGDRRMGLTSPAGGAKS